MWTNHIRKTHASRYDRRSSDGSIDDDIFLTSIATQYCLASFNFYWMEWTRSGFLCVASSCHSSSVVRYECISHTRETAFVWKAFSLLFLTLNEVTLGALLWRIGKRTPCDAVTNTMPLRCSTNQHGKHLRVSIFCCHTHTHTNARTHRVISYGHIKYDAFG